MWIFFKNVFFFFQIIFGLLSVDMRSWTEHLVQSTSFEMRDLTPGSDYGISIQSVLGTDVSRAVIKELSTRKRHDCTWRKTSSVVVGSFYERYVFHYLLVMCLEPVNELSQIKKNKKRLSFTASACFKSVNAQSTICDVTVGTDCSARSMTTQVFTPPLEISFFFFSS